MPWHGDKDGLCLYHSPQPKDDDTARGIWGKARDMAAQGRALFVGWQFPPDPGGRYFASVDFFGEADFRSTVFQLGADFEGATLHASVTFEGARFRRGVPKFDESVFKGPVTFRWAEFSDASHFHRTVFRSTASFERAKFCFAATFSEAVFEGNADFSHVTFQTAAYFEQTRFAGEVKLEWARIVRDADFQRATFTHKASFQNVDFEGNVRFQKALFGGEACFAGTTYKPGRDICFDKPGHGRPFRDSAQGEKAYDLAKRAAYGRRDVLNADIYYYWEWKARAAAKRGEKSLRNRIWGPVVHVLLYLSGTPYRLLVLVAATIAVLGLVFWYFGSISPAPRQVGTEAGFLECLLFSASTFVGLSYGDWQPHGNWSALACGEALLGVFLMAWFVVVLARRLLA